METRLKLKLSKLFQTCWSKHISDVSGDPFFFPENHHHRQLIALFSPKPHSKTSHVSANTHKPTKNKPRHRKPIKTKCFSSTTDNYYYDWRSSDDEIDTDDQNTLFSSRSFRSESSGSFRKKRVYSKSKKKLKRKNRQCGIKFDNQRDFDKMVLENRGEMVKDSIAVAKKSGNPYEDFRLSMVEMIVEKQIFGAEGLRNLFECFISLNSGEHHGIIFEVFTEVLDALFSSCD